METLTKLKIELIFFGYVKKKTIRTFGQLKKSSAKQWNDTFLKRIVSIYLH